MRRLCTGHCLAGENCDHLYFNKALRLRAGLCAVYGIKKETPGRGNETNSRNIEKTQKRCKKVLTKDENHGNIAKLSRTTAARQNGLKKNQKSA